MVNNMNDPKVVVALDFDKLKSAYNFVDKVDPSLCKLKVGKEMFTHFGPEFVKHLVDKQFKVFLDLKFHDIPNTVAKACIAAADMGIWMVNVHACGGPLMMEQARKGLEAYGLERPLLIAVTVLTSMDQAQLNAVGINRSLTEQVLHLAKLTRQSGLDGVVCSAQESSLLKREVAQDFVLVTPGIRPAGSDIGDQIRVMTPKEAVIAGSDYLVIGRPVTQAENPLQTLIDINNSLV